jgi:pyruvate dehydrogenase E2 component (dihydrolipoamide acetyltransferase)
VAKEVIMPKFGMTQEEATIVQWVKKDGDAVEKGDPICEVETEKVNMEVEAPSDGILAGIRYGEGETVPVTVVIAYILSQGEELPKTEPIEKDKTPYAEGSQLMKKGSEDAVANEDRKEGMSTSIKATNDEGTSAAVKATPVAKKLSEKSGVQLEQIHGTGTGGKITKEDVEEFASCN